MRKCLAVEPAAEISGTFERPSNPASTPTTLTTSFEYDDCNKFTGITNPDLTTETLSYDDNGQLIRREKYAVGGDGSGDGNGEAGGGVSPVEVTSYEWNDQGMLVKVILPNGEPVEYQYDGNQRLTGRISADGVDQFVQSGWDIMTKTDDVGKRTYYTGMSAVSGGMSAVSGAGSSSGSSVSGSSSASSSAFSASESASVSDSAKYFHYNHRGDTVLVTDSEGNILNNFSYEAYGRPTNSEGFPVNNLSVKNIPNLFIGSSGIRYDTKTNLHYMRFRWFSAAQMRFISPDLLMDLNRYAYVSGNPIKFIDPKGLQSISIDKIYRNKIHPTFGANEVVYYKHSTGKAIAIDREILPAYEKYYISSPYGTIGVGQSPFELMYQGLLNPDWLPNSYTFTYSPIGIGGFGIQNVDGDWWIFPLAGVVIPGPSFSVTNVTNYDKCKYRGWFIGAGLPTIEASSNIYFDTEKEPWSAGSYIGSPYIAISYYIPLEEVVDPIVDIVNNTLEKIVSFPGEFKVFGKIKPHEVLEEAFCPTIKGFREFMKEINITIY